MGLVDIIFLISLSSIWTILLVNIILAISGYIYYLKSLKFKDEKLKEYPFVSILVPAHNEGKVIGKTVESVLLLDYPRDKMELIVINDNSSDNSKEVLESIKIDIETIILQ
ncbi:glycosyltransferase [Paraclostridium sordellii]|uniref:glycosyltransferase n=1 Tax=Paraclostridium sordellii TaxID=1505 RepID=UPI0005E6771B|nr:glycosyltransferase [Paeniclostridium sordellii]CEQ26855.1 family 2 glycosyl transferase [[Clostridium] sordellii] [Paeniclostridium sordellii]